MLMKLHRIILGQMAETVMCISYENRYTEYISSGGEQNLKTKHKYAKKR